MFAWNLFESADGEAFKPGGILGSRRVRFAIIEKAPLLLRFAQRRRAMR